MLDFIWRVSHDRIQIMENLLKRRNIQMNSNINCEFCNECVESSQHLLFECRFAHYIWLSSYQWFGDTRGLPSSCITYFWQHSGMIKEHKENQFGGRFGHPCVEYVTISKWFDVSFYDFVNSLVNISICLK